MAIWGAPHLVFKLCLYFVHFCAGPRAQRSDSACPSVLPMLDFRPGRSDSVTFKAYVSVRSSILYSLFSKELKMCQVCQRDRDDGWIKCSSNCNTWFHLDCASKGTTRLHSESEWHCPHCTVANKRRTDNSKHNCAMCDESVTMKEGHACEGILCGRWYCNKCYRSLKDDEKVRDPYWYCPECHTTIKREKSTFPVEKAYR